MSKKIPTKLAQIIFASLLSVSTVTTAFAGNPAQKGGVKAPKTQRLVGTPAKPQQMRVTKTKAVRPTLSRQVTEKALDAAPASIMATLQAQLAEITRAIAALSASTPESAHVAVLDFTKPIAERTRAFDELAARSPTDALKAGIDLIEAEQIQLRSDFEILSIIAKYGEGQEANDHYVNRHLAGDPEAITRLLGPVLRNFDQRYLSHRLSEDHMASAVRGVAPSLVKRTLQLAAKYPTNPLSAEVILKVSDSLDSEAKLMVLGWLGTDVLSKNPTFNDAIKKRLLDPVRHYVHKIEYYTSYVAPGRKLLDTLVFMVSSDGAMEPDNVSYIRAEIEEHFRPDKPHQPRKWASIMHADNKTKILDYYIQTMPPSAQAFADAIELTEATLPGELPRSDYMQKITPQVEKDTVAFVNDLIKHYISMPLQPSESREQRVKALESKLTQRWERVKGSYGNSRFVEYVPLTLLQNLTTQGRKRQ